MRIDAPCLDCATPITVEIRDGNVLRTDPPGLVGYVAVPFWRWLENIAFA